jgi:Na+/melibiose symporter-like transporter
MALVTLGTILLLILVVLLIAAVPAWPHSRGWGYGPSGIMGFFVLVLVFLLLTGRVSF